MLSLSLEAVRAWSRGELTRVVPLEMVDAVLAETGKVHTRVRVLPSRVVVYLLLAAGLFAELGFGQVWAKMTAGLDGLAVAIPTAGGAGPGPPPVGTAPLRALFDLLLEQHLPPSRSLELLGVIPVS